jgi:hypothetical protein
MNKWWIALIVVVGILLSWQSLAPFIASELSSAVPGLAKLGLAVSGFTVLAALFIRLSHLHVDHGNTMFWSSLALGVGCIFIPKYWDTTLNLVGSHTGPLLDTALGHLGG